MSTDIKSINDNISVIIGDDLLSHCTLEKFTSNTRIEHIDICSSSPEVDEEAKRIYENMLKKRALDFSNGVDIFKEKYNLERDMMHKNGSLEYNKIKEEKKNSLLVVRISSKDFIKYHLWWI